MARSCSSSTLAIRRRHIACLSLASVVLQASAQKSSPDSVKMKKQMAYANAKQVPFVALAGESEIAEGKLTLKNMTTGEQSLVTPEELIAVVNG